MNLIEVLQHFIMNTTLIITSYSAEITFYIITGIAALVLFTFMLILIQKKSGSNVEETELNDLLTDKTTNQDLSGDSTGLQHNTKEKGPNLNCIWIDHSDVDIHYSTFQDPEETAGLFICTKESVKTDWQNNMVPPMLSKAGLFKTLKNLFEEYSNPGKVNAVLDIRGRTDRLPDNVEIMMYHIVFNMLNLSLVHSDANQISLFIDCFTDRIRLQYSDNGKGFLMKDVKENKIKEISAIQSRVAFLNGELEVETAHGKGLSCFVNLPVHKFQLTKTVSL